MNVFEEGYLKDNNGKIIDFSKSIIIATTNAGHMDTSNPIGLNRKKHGTSVSELSGHFKLALINRFQHRLTFHEITSEIYEEIMRDTYSKEVRLIKRLKPGAALEDELPDSVLKELCDESFDVRFGARPVRTAVCNYIDNKLLEGCA